MWRPGWVAPCCGLGGKPAETRGRSVLRGPRPQDGGSASLRPVAPWYEPVVSRGPRLPSDGDSPEPVASGLPSATLLQQPASSPSPGPGPHSWETGITLCFKVRVFQPRNLLPWGVAGLRPTGFPWDQHVPSDGDTGLLLGLGPCLFSLPAALLSNHGLLSAPHPHTGRITRAVAINSPTRPHLVH